MNKILRSPELRNKLLFSLGMIAVFRLLAHVPVPGVDLASIRQFLQSNALFGLLDIFSGGGFQTFSIVTLGVGPYINASIILQLFTIMIPQLEELSKEGATGREKINTYTRLLSVPISLAQSYGIYFLLTSQKIIPTLDIYPLIILILTLTTGTMLLMWLGELVTEYGIGNGISLLIFAGIIGRLPIASYQYISTLSADNFMTALIYLGAVLLAIFGIVMVNEGTRNIPLEYGRKGFKSEKVRNYLPLKINQAGVIPIIFAVSVVLLPSMLSAPLMASANSTLSSIGNFLAIHFKQTSVGYNVFYFLLVFGFTYFYTTIQFNPEKIADDVKKRGGYIPGIRPGKATTTYLTAVMNRITLAGGLFLGLIAIMPYLLEVFLGVTSFAIGGTAVLIVVSVVLEIIRQTQSLVVTKNYQNYLD